MYCSIKRVFYDSLKGKADETLERTKRTGGCDYIVASTECVFYRIIVNTVRRSGIDRSLH